MLDLYNRTNIQPLMGIVRIKTNPVLKTTTTTLLKRTLGSRI